MGIFRLTVAEDEVEKRTTGYKNLRSMLYGFTIAFAVALVSGFWYHLVPRDINWNASQVILLLHLAGGVISLFLLLPFFFLHQKNKEQRWWWLLMPWKLKREVDEEPRHFRQRQLGHLLSWILLTVYGSGVVIAIPGLLFNLGTVWMQGYYTSQILNLVHLWASVLLLPLLFTHLLWKTGMRK